MKRMRDLVPWRSTGTPAALRHEPELFRSLRREMDRLFDDFFTEPLARLSPFGERVRAFSPTINVEETDSDLVVTAELPGLEPNQVNISLTEDALTISGEKKSREERKEGRYYYSESTEGAFERVIPFGGMEVDPDRVQASMKQGCLTIVLPKTETERRTARKVSIRTE